MNRHTFIEIEKSKRTKDWSMAELHSHRHYELYFLLEGKRRFLFANTLLELSENSLVVIPPFVLHKTEGGPFFRINVNCSPNSLSPFAKETLDDCFRRTAVTFDAEEMTEIRKILDELLKYSDKFAPDIPFIKQTLADYLIYRIYTHTGNNPIPTVSMAQSVPSVLLKIIDYINKNYAEELSLQRLSEEFFLSEVSLCNYFKKYLNCTIGTYVVNLRLSKAKELLALTKQPIEEIAAQTGFSSANYFGLVFKKNVGLSPLHYRKHQREKN